MEESLKYIRALRSQIYDAEDQAAKLSFEEQMLVSSIRANDEDLLSVKSKTAQLEDGIEGIRKAKAEICSQIYQKQRQITSFESDTSNLIQSLELIQQEKLGLSAKLLDKSNYYRRTIEETRSKFQDQQDWIKLNYQQTL